MTSALPSAPPLAGLRIVELSSYVATPLCGLTLAQLGAEVIRVEPVGGAPDRSRWPLARDGSSLYWNGLNAGKRSIEVDLDDPAGRRLVSDLVVFSGGILVTNTERWQELSFSALRERRQDIVHVLLTGKHDGSTAVDYTVQAGSGFPLVTGPRDNHAPINHVLPAWDMAAGLYLAVAVLSAERQRLESGRGGELRLALEDVALATAGQLGYLAQAQVSPETPRIADGNSIYGTFGRDFVTADGKRFMIVALTTRQWRDLLRMTELDEVMLAVGLALAADFSDEGDRYRHREVIAALVAGWFQQHDAGYVEQELVKTRILWSPYRSFADLAADDARALREHPLFGVVDQPGVGPILAPGSPITLGQLRGIPAAAPSIGEHTSSVLAEYLEMSPRQIDDAASRGVVRDPAPTAVPSRDLRRHS
ncbi:CoA transferase [Jatrophihabitans sp.]|uniref:CoA transferase n=1 Tax=Jatrophihabitans sp. TaxID=1932789 RepID=UPI0030C659FB|nr:L-carnitine dehydratase/bile acid-inducible protein [Jatrophihabitans sp.]